MEFKAISRKTCEKFCNQSHEKTSVIISIKSPWDKEDPGIYIAHNGTLLPADRLRFFFTGTDPGIS